MPLSSVDELKEQIQFLPATLRAALEQHAKAQTDVVRLETQIEKLQATIETENKTKDDDDDYSSDGLEDDREQLKLEQDVERLKLKLSEAEDKAELEIRQSATKFTERHVAAAVSADANVSQLRHSLLDAKEAAKTRKVTLHRERQLARIAELEERRNPEIELENPRLLELQSRLAEAEEKVIFAELEVEVARTTIDTFKMLVHLEEMNK